MPVSSYPIIEKEIAMKLRPLVASPFVFALLLSVLPSASSAQLYSVTEMQAGRAGLRDTLAFDEGETAAQIQASVPFSNPSNPERILTFSGQAQARAAYGSLGASASATVENPFLDPDGDYTSPPQEFFLFAQSEFADELIFTPGESDPTEGFTASFTYTVEGSTTGAYSYGNVLFTLNGDTEAFEISAGGTITSQPYQLQWNTPIELVTSLQSGFYVDLEAEEFTEGQTISGAADFYNTVTLSGISVFDANGNTVANFRATGSSGTIYYAPVPAPNSLLLAFLGSAPIVGVLVRRRRHQVTVKCSTERKRGEESLLSCLMG
jgi:hypothetical protein